MPPRCRPFGDGREPPADGAVYTESAGVKEMAVERTGATGKTSGFPARPASRRTPGLFRDILLTGAGAALASAAVAASFAKAEGKGALQPLNATSHWLHGEAAGRVSRLDGSHSGVGIATHILSALFWAVPYALWLRSAPDRSPGRSPGEIVGGAAATAIVAAAVDYGAMPRRLSPGWELALDRPGIAATFVGLGLGLAGGALVARGLG